MTARKGPEECLPLGEYDVAVVGGGVSGTICAASLSDEGYRVVVVEPRGALMWELTKARQTAVSLSDREGVSPVLGELQAQLRRAGALREDQVEPVLTQLIADQFLEQRHARILFQARGLKVDWDDQGKVSGLLVAVKGGYGRLRVHGCVDCSDTALILRAAGVSAVPAPSALAYWTLTCVGVTVDKSVETEITHRNRVIPIRVRPGFWPDECCIDVAFPIQEASGLSVGGSLADVVESVRSRLPSVASVKLAHVSDEPWALPNVSIDTQQTPHLPAVARDEVLIVGFGLVGTGAWLPPVREEIAALPVWHQSARAVTRLIEVGESAGKELLSQFRTGVRRG